MKTTIKVISLFIALIWSDCGAAPYPIKRRLSPGKTTYFIDPIHGDDQNKGTELKRAWKTFKPVNQLILSAGDLLEITKAGAFHESLELIATGKPALPVTVRFAAGRYDFFPDHALKQQLHISNTNDVPYEKKAIAMLFDHCQFLHIEGIGAKIILRGKMIETFVNHCTDINLTGLSYDYQRPTVSELKVIGVASNYADLKIHQDSKYSIKDSILTWQGEGWGYAASNYWQVLNLQTNDLSRLEMPMANVRFASVGEGLVRAYFNRNPGFQKDLIYQNRDVTRDCAGLFLQRSKNVSLKNIRIYFMHGMGVVSQYCENIKLTHVIVKPDESSGRTCAAWADILHFSGCKGLIEIGHSYLSAANDDAVNIHGIHLRVIQKEGPNQIRIKFMHNQTFGFAPFSVGDSLDFIHTETLLPIGNNLVLATRRVNDKEFILTLKNPLPGNLLLTDVVENTTATPKVWIHDNTITRIPTRGILTTTRRKIVIEHNKFLRTHLTGILVNDDAFYWYESGMVRNLMIRDNNFVKCGEPVIAVIPNNETTSEIAVHTNISVINNTFEMLGTKLFSARSTSQIKINDNTVSLSKPASDLKELVELDHCQQIEIVGNKIIVQP